MASFAHSVTKQAFAGIVILCLLCLHESHTLITLAALAWLVLPFALCVANSPSPAAAEAQVCPGAMYAHDSGSYDAETIRGCREAAERGIAVAQKNLGIAYHAGNGVTQDYAEAARWFLKAAEQGNAEAQFYLGMAYDQGEGVTQDEAEALKWWRKAADQGDADAQQRLAAWRPKSN